MIELQQQLFALADAGYAEFQHRIVPNVPAESFIGVRLPLLRKLARSLAKSEQYEEFLHTLPHRYYDENILHAVLLANMRDFSVCLNEVDRFLLYVDNWAVCDTIRPKSFAVNKATLLPEVKRWIASVHGFTCRFGLDMLMTYFLDDAFTADMPELAATVDCSEYYVHMMVAWYFATALAKQWDSAIPYLEQRRLAEKTHQMAIRKACESFRITDEQKNYLKTLK